MESLCILRCSVKDRQLVVYFTLILDCNVAVLDSLFFNSFAYLAFANNNWQETFARELCKYVDHRIRQSIGPRNTALCWTNQETELDWHTTVSLNEGWQLVLLLMHGHWIALKITFFVSESAIFITEDGSNAERKSVRPNRLECLVNDAVDRAIKLFLQ